MRAKRSDDEGVLAFTLGPSTIIALHLVTGSQFGCLAHEPGFGDEDGAGNEPTHDRGDDGA